MAQTGVPSPPPGQGRLPPLPPAALPLATHSGRELALRDNLDIREIVEDGTSFFVIKDPERERFFRVKPLEYYLIKQFDGRTSFDKLRQRASQEKKVLVGEPVLRGFAAKFLDLGLLVDIRRRRPREAPLSPVRYFWNAKFRLGNPEALIERLHPLTRPLISPGFVAAALAMMLGAIWIAIGHRAELAFGLRSVVNVEGILLVIPTIVLITALHELAHGVTCRHYGGRVTDMGFMFVYLLPCFYCNVSETYFLKEKRHRIWVLLAGGFIEMTLWAMCVLVWRLVDPASLVARICFVVIAVSAVRTLFNFNPLIKMDGYYMLSDALSIKNLRSEALRGVTDRARRWLGLSRTPPSKGLRDKSWLDIPATRWLTLFGVASLVYTAAVVVYLAQWSFDLVFEQFGGNGIAIYSLVLVGLLRKPVVTAAHITKSVTREKWVQLKTPNKRVTSGLFWLLPVVVIALFPWNQRVTSSLTVLPSMRESVRATTSGRIKNIHVEEGAVVSAGALILELDDRPLLLERDTKLAERSKAEQELRLLSKQNPTSREEITIKRRELESARARQQTARREFERQEQLVKLGLTPMTEFDRAQHRLNEAASEMREAEATFSFATKSSPDSRTEQMEVLHLRDVGAQHTIIAKLEAELLALEDRLARTRVYSKISGTVTTYRIEEKLGEYLEEGSLICEVMNDDQVVVEMPISEKDIDIVEVGKEVQFKVRGYPGRRFKASVDEISPIARSQGDATTILVRSRIDNHDRVLKPGMTGVAKIYTGLSFVARVVSRDLVRFIRTEFWL